MSESAAGFGEQAEPNLAEPIEIGAVSLQPTNLRKRQRDLDSLFGLSRLRRERYALCIGSWRTIIVREASMGGTSMRLEPPKQSEDREPGWVRHRRERRRLRRSRT